MDQERSDRISSREKLAIYLALIPGSILALALLGGLLKESTVRSGLLAAGVALPVLFLWLVPGSRFGRRLNPNWIRAASALLWMILLGWFAMTVLFAVP